VPSFVRVQISLLALSIVVPAACNALVLLGSVDPLVASNISGATLVVSWVGLVITPLVLGSGARTAVRLSALLVCVGFCQRVGTGRLGFHLVPASTAPSRWATAADRWLWYWWMYAVADTRFLRADPADGGARVRVGTPWVRPGLRPRQLLERESAPRLLCVDPRGGAGILRHRGVLRGGSPAGIPKYHSRFLPSFYVKWWGMNGLWLVMPIVAPFAYARLLREPGYDAATVLRREVFGMARSTRTVSSGPQTAAERRGTDMLANEKILVTGAAVRWHSRSHANWRARTRCAASPASAREATGHGSSGRH